MNNSHEWGINSNPSPSILGAPIDLGRLDNVRESENKITAACPACRELGHDKKGKHLVIYRNGKFGCVLFPGAAADSKEHRQQILTLAGRRPTRRAGTRQSSAPHFAAQVTAPPLPVLLGGVILDPPARTFIHADRDLEELTTSLATVCPQEIALAAEDFFDGSLAVLALYAPPATRHPTIIEVGRVAPAAATKLLEQLVGKTMVVHGAQALLRSLARWQPGFHFERMDWWCTWTAAKLLSNGLDLECNLNPVLKRYLSLCIARQGKDGADSSSIPREMNYPRLADSVRHLSALREQLAGDLTDMRMDWVFALESSLLPVTHDLNGNGWEIDLPPLHAERAHIVTALEAATPSEGAPLRGRMTQIDGWLCRLDPDGRLRATYDPLGTVTGRFSAREPNLQGVPRGPLRAAFRAAKGYSLVIGDLSQIELRITAVITGDSAMLRAFRRGEDLHRLTASAVLEKDLAEVTERDRQLGKVTNFGLIYGQSAAGFVTYAQAHGVHLTLEKAKQIRTRFFEAYPRIAAWHHRAWRSLRSPRLSAGVTVLTRRRFLPDNTSDWERFQARTNHLIQGSAADLFKTALVELHPQLEPCGARLIGTVHDEVILEAPRAATEHVTRLLERTFEEAFVLLFNVVSKAHFERGLRGLFRDRPACEVQTYVCTNWAEKG